VIKSFLKWTVLSVLAVSLISCASTNIKNIDEQEGFVFYQDEANLWKQVDEFHAVMERSGFVYQDKELEEYVNSIADKMFGEILKKYNFDLRVYLIKDPIFNAGAYPNGVIYVNTSILATLENEAQLATILAHEGTHVIHRHALKTQNFLINKTAFYKFFDITMAGATGAVRGGVVGNSLSIARLIGGLGIAGAIYGYSRVLEEEADEYAYKFIVDAGYDPRESKKAYQNISTALEEEKIKAPYFYSTHPKIKQRVRNFEQYLKSYEKENKEAFQKVINEEVYMGKVKDLILENAELELKRNKLNSAIAQLKRYNRYFKNSPESYDLLGRIYVAKMEFKKHNKNKDKGGKTDDSLDHKQAAMDAFGQANQINPDYPHAYKHLGLLYYKKGERQKASGLFKKYMDLNPQAEDGEYIRGYIHESE